MTPIESLREKGQSIWLDDLNRALLEQGRLARYVRELSVSGLTSNPSTFHHALRHTEAYDASLRSGLQRGLRGEALFFEVALQDLSAAATLFRPVHEQTGAQDGWVSLEVSPRLADDAKATIREAQRLHALATIPNLMIKIPGTRAGLEAIEEATFEGVNVNVTLLFSADQYLDAAGAYMKGMERRLDAGRSPDVHSVASVFVSRWDTAVRTLVPKQLQNRLGIAIAQRTYRAYHELREGTRWRRLSAKGVPLQKLLLASMSTKDPNAPDTLYVDSLVAPDTIDTMPEKTLLAFAEHGQVRGILSPSGGDSERVLAEFGQVGVDVDMLAKDLQRQGTASFVKSWTELLEGLEEKCRLLDGATSWPSLQNS
jgi:transaldolase